MTAATQAQVDAVASFVEACAELQREPFFGKDERLSWSGGGERTTFILGDRFHFRSALISFRRIWMKGESSYWENVLGILNTTGLPHVHASLANHEAEQIRKVIADTKHFQMEMQTGRIIDLWLNTVFAHDGLTGKNKRSDFEAAVAKHGHARFEYTFRNGVKWLGIHFINLSRLSATPALTKYEEEQALKPSFKIGAAFGIKRRERTSEGHVVIRQGSSEFFSEETFEERFERILARSEHRELSFVLKHLECTKSELLRAVMRTQSAAELLSVLDGLLDTSDVHDAAAKKYFMAQGWLGSTNKVTIFADNVVATNQAGVRVLDEALGKFHAQLTKE